MKKYGFTLIELLAVILILGIIALIAIPTVNKILEESRRGAFKSTRDNLERAIAQKCTTDQIKDAEHETTYSITNGVISPDVDVKGDLPDGTIYVDSDCGVTYELANTNFVANKDNPNSNVTIDKCTGNCTRYAETLLNGATPKLDSGLIPITLDNDGIVKKADLSQPWYSYEKQEWANAVLVTDSSRETIQNASAGSIINSTDILAYLVWIPRYKYFIPTGGTTTPNPIKIVFENKTTIKSTGNAVSSYYTHPAFTFGDTEVDGIWVGKFETTGDATTPTVLPNVTSLRSQNVSTQFATAQKFGNYGSSGDAHMMKNSEWGAMAYLSHSIYGINKEVRINNNSSFITGCGASTENASGSSSCSIAYAKSTSYPQSTTGNITGIFDTSGGAFEWVMGNYNNTISSSGFTTMPSSKYFDLYTTSSYETACLGDKCKGHAGYETKNWYSDYYYVVSSGHSWVTRGGSYFNRSQAGIFSTSDYDLSRSVSAFRFASLVAV